MATPTPIKYFTVDHRKLSTAAVPNDIIANVWLTAGLSADLLGNSSGKTAIKPKKSCNFASMLRLAVLCLLLLPGMVLRAQIPAGMGRMNPESRPGGTDTMRKISGVRSDPGSARFTDLSAGRDSFSRWDSTLPMTQRYDIARATGMPFVDLGHYASPQKNLLLDPFVQTGLHSGFNPYAFQNVNPETFTFYRAKVPLTRFNYQQGGNGFIALQAMHTQNIRKNWNVTVDYRSVNNREYYINSKQDHLHRGTSLGSFYTSKNGKLKQFTILTWNRARRLENGGMENDSLLYFDNTIDKQSPFSINTRGVYRTRLSAALSVYANRHHLSETQYSMGKGKPYLFHRADWSRSNYRYLDPRRDTGFYGAQYFRSKDSLNDSSAWNGLSNRLGLGHQFKTDKIQMGLRAWYSYEWMSYGAKYFLSGKDENVSQGLHTNAFGQGNGWLWQAEASTYINGYNKGDYNLMVNGQWNPLKRFTVSGRYQAQKATPGLFQQRFFSNQFRISNNWPAVKSTAAELGIAYHGKRTRLELAYITGKTEGLIYNSGDAVFRRASEITYSQIRGHIHLQAGKLHTDHIFYLQNISDKSVWSAPGLSTLSSLYLQGYMFKKALHARFGVDVAWQSEYTAWAYRPDMATFYISNSGRPGGNYPLADIFLSGEIKTVIVTFKMAHINNYLVNYGVSNAFMSAQGYAIEPQRFVLGLVWRFHY